MTALALADRLTSVYRLFDDDDTLLYVGCSCEPDRRVRADHLFKPWGQDVAYVTRAWYVDRFAALRQEARAIVEESPIYNVRRTPPERIRKLEPVPAAASPDSGLSLRQVAEEVGIPVHWLWRGLATGTVPHSCTDPEGDDVWFTRDDIRDLHAIYDVRCAGLAKPHRSRAAVRRAIRFKRCCHAAI